MPVDIEQIAARLTKAKAYRVAIQGGRGHRDSRPPRQRGDWLRVTPTAREVDGEMGEQPAVTLVPLGAPRGRRSWVIRHNGRRYAVFDVGGELQVTDAACPHNGGPLARGVVRKGVVTCPWHWYSFELRSGRCLTSASYHLRKYPVISRDGRSYAELPGGIRRPRWFRRLRVDVRADRPGAPPG